MVGSSSSSLGLRLQSKELCSSQQTICAIYSNYSFKFKIACLGIVAKFTAVAYVLVLALYHSMLFNPFGSGSIDKRAGVLYELVDTKG